MALTPEQVIALSKANPTGITAQQAVGLATPAPTPTPTPTPAQSGIISAATLGSNATPVTPTVPVQKEPVYAPTVDSYALTPTEKVVQDGTASLMDLTNQLLGKSAYTTEQENKYGVTEKQNAVNDFTNQLNAINTEAKQIPMQIQQDAQMGGANVTKGGLAPVQTAALRNNAIRALSVGSLLSAAQGNLTLALDQADRAVKAKYDIIKEQRDATIANLDAIMRSPAYTLEQQKRAAQIKAQELAKANADKKEEENANATSDAVISALYSNPSMSTEARAALQAAKTPIDVAAIVSYFGLTTLSEKEQLSQFNADRSFTQTQANADRAFNEEQRQFNATYAQNQDKINQAAQETGQDPEQIVAYAQEYAATGKIPTGIPKGAFAAISQVAKETPKQPGEIISTATGVHPAGDTTYADALSNLTSVINLAKTLKEQDASRIGGVLAGTLGKITGSEAQGSYMSTRSQIVDLLSRARSGAALTENEVKTYEGMLPGRFSEPFGLGQNSDVRIQNFIDALTKDLTSKASSKGWAVYGVSKVKLNDGNEYFVGQTIENADGIKGRVNADGSITILQ